MAGVVCRVNSGAVTLSAATEKTALQIIAASNHRVLIRNIIISFLGTSNSAVPVAVEIARETSGGSGGSSESAVKNGDFGETIQTTAYKDASTPGTKGDVLIKEALHPQLNKDKGFAITREIIVPGGTRLGVRLTAPAGVDAIVDIEFEE